MSHTKTVSLVVLGVVLCASPAFAEEGVIDVQVETSAEASVSTETSPAPTPFQKGEKPMRPLDAIKARAQQIKNKSMDAKIELRADTKAQMKAAPPGEKREVMKNAIGERKDIARERMASTTQLARGMKALMLKHGGEIKNRFRLAISHMNNILGRIDTRLNKMASSGVDTSSVVQLKVEAEAAVDAAEASALAVSSYIESATDSSDRAQVKTELQAKIKTAHTAMKTAHESVKKVVRALVDLSKENKAKVDAAATVETDL